MPRYRKKPIVIEAIQWTGKNLDELCFKFPECFGSAIIQNDREIVIKTREGNMIANIDDFIIKGIKGEFYPCKPDIFEATYEAEEKKDYLLNVAESLTNYINALDSVDSLKDVEMLHFSMDIYRTDDKEMTFSHPCLTVSKYKESEDDRQCEPSITL